MVAVNSLRIVLRILCDHLVGLRICVVLRERPSLSFL